MIYWGFLELISQVGKKNGAVRILNVCLLSTSVQLASFDMCGHVVPDAEAPRFLIAVLEAVMRQTDGSTAHLILHLSATHVRSCLVHFSFMSGK